MASLLVIDEISSIYIFILDIHFIKVKLFVDLESLLELLIFFFSLLRIFLALSISCCRFRCWLRYLIKLCFVFACSMILRSLITLVVWHAFFFIKCTWFACIKLKLWTYQSNILVLYFIRLILRIILFIYLIRWLFTLILFSRTVTLRAITIFSLWWIFLAVWRLTILTIIFLFFLTLFMLIFTFLNDFIF